MADSFDFKVKTLVNEMAPVLILMELESQGEALSAAQINREITQGRFERSQGDEKFKYQPSLIYNLMKALVENNLVKRDPDENTYSILPEGREFLKEQMPRLLEFANDLKEFIADVRASK